jgi:regulator of protease activity HflC (stomatin/prohibitin superfamily)
MSDSGGAGAILGGLVGVVLLVVLAVTGIGFLASWHGTAPGDVCVVQEGGIFDGRSVKEIRQGGEGPKSIGIWNHQRCLPATQRNYIVSADPTQGDTKSVDFVEVPTLDAVNVKVEGQALFRLNTNPDVIKDFYKKYGVRTFDGKHPYDGDTGWQNFLAIQFRPVLDNALREAIGSFNCVDLNNTCQYVTSAQEAVKGNVKKVANSQNLNAAQQKIEQQLQSDLNSTLGGPYFENIRFRLRGVKFEDKVQQQISDAQAKRTEVATQQLEANRQVAEAEGRRQVAIKDAEARQAARKGYARNPVQARIDTLKALCGTRGCQNLQVIGGAAVTKFIGK